MTNAIFDLDGTLYTGHIARGLARHHRAHRVNRLPLYFFMATHMPLWWLQRAGLLSKETMNEQWANHMGWTVRGITTERAVAVFAWVAERYIEPRARPDVMARLREHQAAGHRVILVSGTPAPLLAAIGRQLGIEETVGTPLIVRDGHYTGACEHPVCQGAHKGTRLAIYLGKDKNARWLRLCRQLYRHPAAGTGGPPRGRLPGPATGSPRAGTGVGDHSISLTMYCIGAGRGYK